MHLPIRERYRNHIWWFISSIEHEKLHKRGPQLFFFFDFMATKFTLVQLSKIISKIRVSKFCILYHIKYTTIEVLLYQFLTFILTFKSKRSMISFGRKQCKYGLHIMGSTQHWHNNTINNKEIRQCFFDPMIYTFMHPFQALHLCLSLMAKTTAQIICEKN